MDTIKAFLEADAKRTQGEWKYSKRPASDYNDLNLHAGCVYIGCYTYASDLPEHNFPSLNEGEYNANLIALASTLAPAIRTMLADIDIAREALLEGIITECEIEWQEDDGSWARETPSHIRKIYAIAHHALSALDKYKGGV